MRTCCVVLLLSLPWTLACGDDDDDGSCTDCVDSGPRPDGFVPMADMTMPDEDGGPPDVDGGPPAMGCEPGAPAPAAWDCSSDPGVTEGEAITAEAMTWTWVGFDDAFCMDGSTTGIGVNLNPASDKLLILMEGGGACFDSISCFGVANQDGYGEGKLNAAAGSTLSSGILDRSDSANPMADWNFVYVPYCTGDAHSGTNTDGFGGRTQTGHTNYQAFIRRIAPTFGDVTQVVLSGRSAGGLGTIVNYPVTASAFGCTPVHMLNDSGALLSDMYLKPCLQALVREEWGVEVPGECTSCTCEDGGGLVNSFPYLARRFPDRRFGLASYTEDGTFRQFFSYGYSRGCNLPSTMPMGDYTAGLLELRTIMEGDTNFASFLVTGGSHTFTYNSLASSSAGGTTLSTWVEQLVEGDASWGNAGP